MILPISKELFIQTIDFIRERNDKQTEIGNLFKSEFDCREFWPYSKYELQLVKLLKHIMRDDSKDSWIEYYLWERNYGTDTTLGDITDANDEPIPFKTSEDLWNLLLENFEDE